MLNLFIRWRATIFLLEDDDSVTVAEAIAESDAVVPVAAEQEEIKKMYTNLLSRSAWTVANSDETVVMAVSKDVT